ncbi:MAG: hypothetical protein P4K83_01740 [Terracidiphilus sp.]|nr:hypothetical protein [Terracidiphilus sp.]
MLNPLMRIFDFTCGIALCAFQNIYLASRSKKHRKLVGNLCLFGGIVVFVAIIALANQIPFLLMSNGMMVPAFSLIILGLVNVENVVSFILTRPWMLILGESSYAIYLFHGVLFFPMRKIVSVDSRLFWMAFIAVLMSMSLLLYHFIEKPLRGYFVRWIDSNVSG